MHIDGRAPRSNLLSRARVIADDSGAIEAVIAFVLFACVLLCARVFADLTPSEIATPWLLASAVGSALPLAILGVAALIGAGQLGRGSLMLTWADLERGGALRRLTAVILFLLMWRFLSAEYDYAYGEWWTLDRLGLLVFAVVSLRHPVALLAVVVQARLLQAPVRSAFGFSSGATLDDLPIVALGAIGTVALLAAITGRRDTHVVVPLLASGTVAQFFVSGRAKLSDGWLLDNELANFPLNGYQQGWLGSGDGQLAEALSSFFATFRWPLLVATLLLEVGGLVLIARRRSFLAALIGFTLFHLFVFLGYGFSFLEWAAVELGVAALLFGAVGARWSAPAFRAAPVALAVAFAVVGGVALKPPTLAWFDGPITYGYEITAIDDEGAEYQLNSQDFAPHESAVAFSFLHLGPSRPVAAGYGALNRQRLDDMETISNWAELATIEAPFTPDARTDRTLANLERFLLASPAPSSVFDWIPDAPRRFSTSRFGNAPPEEADLQQLSITRVTIMRIDGEALERREQVVELHRVEDGVDIRWMY